MNAQFGHHEGRIATEQSVLQGVGALSRSEGQ
jgi:hypothetical protein